MNKLNKIFTAALIALTINTFAADCPALSGKYLIGKTDNADFATVNDAVNALKCGGVSGPVTFMLETGNYNEKIVLSAITGASAFNTVTFESKSGNSADAVISYTASDATLVLNGISHVNFENLTIDHKTAAYGNSMRVDGKTGSLHFKSVVFNGVDISRTGANSATVYFSPSAPKTDIAFEDCEINNGSTGIFKGGASADSRDSKTSISGTLFFNQYEAGLALSNEEAAVITNNVISSLSSFASFKAINLDDVSGNLIISNNIVNASAGSMGLILNNCVAEATNLGQISNNSIAVGGKGETYGIFLSGNTDNQAFYKNASSGNNINMMNNLCYDLSTGGYTIIGNTYKDFFNQLPAQSNPALSVSANGIMIEKVTPIK
jgi:hypothetical protein